MGNIITHNNWFRGENEMKFTRIDTIEDYIKVIDKYKNESFCFRGQVNHFELSDGLTSFITSFQKNGCNPFYMFKWTYFSQEILRNYCQEDWEQNLNEMEQQTYSQAILQHYGWRSFFVDITTDIKVASWFACNKYSDHTTFAMVEDAFEEPLIEVQKTVSYETKQDTYGYIYVFNKDNLSMSKDYHFVNLLTNNIFNDNTRPFRQKGCLFGGQNKDNRHLSEDLNKCLVDILEVKVNVLGALTKDEGLNQNYLFPSFEEDYIYASFIGLPRTILDNDTLPFYKPSLDIPVYDNFFIKRNPLEIAFYSNFWIADENFELYAKQMEDTADTLLNITFIKIDEFWLYAKSLSSDANPILSILEQLGDFVLEFDYPCRIFEEEFTTYKKGVRCKIDNEGDIAISELTIEHPSSSMSGFSFNFPIYYRLDTNNNLQEIKKPDSCPCNNPQRHRQNLELTLNFCDAIDKQQIKLTKIDNKKLKGFVTT